MEINDLRKLSNHGEEMSCITCLEEEKKSKTSPKYQGTTILERMILPHRECWICKSTFENSKDQIEHFVSKHECNFCWKSFDDPDLKLKHFENGHKCKLCQEVFQGNFRHNKKKHLEYVHEG